MVKKSNSITMIGYLLAAFYGVRIIGEFRILTLGFQWPSVLLTLIFLAAMIAAIGVAQMKESSRHLLVLVNAGILGTFIVMTLVLKINGIADMALSIIVILYFSQARVKRLFSDHLGLNRKSILIIDDDPAFIKTIKPILLTNGFSVLTALTGEKGIQVAKKQKPDLIVLDVILPGVKGREVCSRLKSDSDTEKIPVIFLTAKDSPDDVEAEIAAGGLSHITKPFSTQKLLEEIRKALGD